MVGLVSNSKPVVLVHLRLNLNWRPIKFDKGEAEVIAAPSNRPGSHPQL